MRCMGVEVVVGPKSWGGTSAMWQPQPMSVSYDDDGDDDGRPTATRVEAV